MEKHVTTKEGTVKKFTGWQLGDVIKEFRRFTGKTQLELCEDISDYIGTLGLDSFNITQSSLAKVEAGRVIKDYNVTRYLYDTILRTDMEERSKIFSIIGQINNATVFTPQDIVNLFYLKTKSEFIDVLKRCIRRDDYFVKEVSESAVNIIKKNIASFPENIQFDILNNGSKGGSSNSTATLVMYTAYHYIVFHYFQSFSKEKYDNLPERFKEIVSFKQLRSDKLNKTTLKEFIDIVWIGLEETAHKDRFGSVLFDAVKYGFIYSKDSDSATKDRWVSKMLPFIRIIAFICFEMQNLVDLYSLVLKQLGLNKRLNIFNTGLFSEKDTRYILSDQLSFLSFIFGVCREFPKYEDLYNQINKLLADKALNDRIINVEALKKEAQATYEDKNLNSAIKSYNLKLLFNMLDSSIQLNKGLF